MRESIGGTMLFWIVLFFMSIFIAFLAAVIQYARVYKIKNSMINYLEEGEGLETIEDFESKLTSLGYPANGKYVVCRYNAANRGGYYYLKLFAEFKIMNVGIDVNIRGETRLIETGILVKSSGIFNNQGTEADCIGRGVRESEKTKEG